MGKTPKVITIDFETDAIAPRPKYPPEPAGVSIMWPGERKPKYLAWNHPTENNCTKSEGRKALLKCYEQKEFGLLFHNAKFDMDVGETKLDLPRLGWERYHDTLFLLFLHDPHSRSLSLKPAAEKLLGMPPEEQDAVRAWLVDNGIVTKQDKRWGAHIAKAPGRLVGRYAEGDVIRTKKLFDKLWPEIQKAGMLQAYDRERRLLPILLDNERVGVRVDTPKLEHDVVMYRQARDATDEWLRKRLKAPDLNVDSNEEMADALEATGVVTDFVMTKTGKRSVAKKNLTLDMFHDKEVASAFGYRNALSTCLGIFMEPWLEQSSQTGGRIYTVWNQVRQAHGNDNLAGARTGRMSSTPPLLNIPKEFPEAIAQPKLKGLVTILRKMRKDRWDHLSPLLDKGLPPLPRLPFVRRYVVPDDKKSVWLRRDYSQQEYRILAHYEDGSLKKAYLENPRTDIHQWLQQMLKDVVGLVLDRKDVKIVNFADIYGMGEGHMAEKLNTDRMTVKRIRAAKRKLMTGLGPLEQEIKARGKNGEPIRTWGGRLYYAEEPKWNGFRWQTYEYKLLNYLIQGSAADCTKEAIIRYHDIRKEGLFKVAVHDEIDLSVPKKALKEESRLLREAMRSVEFDVPMLSDGEFGPNWYDLKEMKEND